MARETAAAARDALVCDWSARLSAAGEKAAAQAAAAEEARAKLAADWSADRATLSSDWSSERSAWERERAGLVASAAAAAAAAAAQLMCASTAAATALATAELVGAEQLTAEQVPRDVTYWCSLITNQITSKQACIAVSFLARLSELSLFANVLPICCIC